MNPRRAALLALGPLLALLVLSPTAGAGPAEGQLLQAPNVIAISEHLVTAGQPTPSALATLSEQHFRAVINLAPPTVASAVANEPELVRGQGIEYVSIPIAWTQPTDAHVQAFFAAMQRFKDRKVLVHCQVNMRASALGFLYQVIVEGQNPATAYEVLSRVWTPDGPWRSLLESQLRQAKIPFALP